MRTAASSIEPAPFQATKLNSPKQSYAALVTLGAAVHVTMQPRCIAVLTTRVSGPLTDQQSSYTCALWLHTELMVPCEYAVASFAAGSHVYVL